MITFNFLQVDNCKRAFKKFLKFSIYTGLMARKMV